MNDWRLLGLALAFVYAMARLQHVNRRAMKFGGLLVLALAGYKTVPMLAPMFAPIEFVSGMGGAVVLGGGGPSARGIPGEQVTVLFQCDWDGTAPRADERDCDGDGFEGYPDDWSVTTGTDSDATTGLDDMEVVDASDEGLHVNWPNDRALLLRCQGGTPCGSNVVRNTQEWANMVAGDVIAYRAAITEASEVLVSGNNNGNDHGWGPTDGGGANASVYIGQMQESAVDSFRLEFDPQYEAFPDDSWCPSRDPGTADCNTNTAPGEGLFWFPGDYALEWHLRIEFVSDTSFAASLRVYDIAGDSLLLDDADFVNKQNGTLDNFVGPFIYQSTDPWNWDYHSLGTSAVSEPTFSADGRRLRYYGGVAVCKDDWCPRYGGLAGEGG